VAYVQDDHLYLLDRAGKRHSLGGPGVPSSPTWSADGDWIAFVRQPAPASGQYTSGPYTVWLARSDGTDLHSLAPTVSFRPQVTWSPSGASVAFETDTGVHLNQPPATSLQSVGPATRGFGFVWTPSGGSLIAGSLTAPIATLQDFPTGGAAMATIQSTSGNSLIPATVSPDGQQVYYWFDPLGSSSIAADGLTLYATPRAGGSPTKLAESLVHPRWLAWSPDGGTLAVVTGGDRVVWDPHRQIYLCKRSYCYPLAQYGGQVSLDPAWTAAGDLVFTGAPAASYSNPSAAPAVLGKTSAETYSADTVEAWYDAQQLWTYTPNGGGPPKPLAAAGVGSHTPLVAGSGLLYVEYDSLWYLPGGTTTPVQVAQDLGDPGVYGKSYYAYIDWSQFFAWHA
jgi:dipeptidyl aminopeptidase/acylaminoacyl peptidase